MRILKGTVSSNKMVKTIVVRVDQLRRHPKYLKYYRISRKYKVNVDDAKEYQIGDMVRIQETRPISKEKRWRVAGLVKRASVAGLDLGDVDEEPIPELTAADGRGNQDAGQLK